MVMARVAQPWFAGDGIIEMHGASARDEKGMADAMFHELLDDVIRKAHHLPTEHFTSGGAEKD